MDQLKATIHQILQIAAKKQHTHTKSHEKITFTAVVRKSKWQEMQLGKAEHHRYSNGHHRADSPDDALTRFWITKTMHTNGKQAENRK